MRGLYYLTQPGSAHGQVEAGLGAGEADGVTGAGWGGGHVKPEAVLVMTRNEMETLTLTNCGLGPKQKHVRIISRTMYYGIILAQCLQYIN